MSLRSGGLFCPLPDTAAAPADNRSRNRSRNRSNAPHGVRCSLYASAEPFDVEAGPTGLYKPSVKVGTDGTQELRAYVESDSPYIAVQLALEGVSDNLSPLVWQQSPPLYARMCLDGSAQPIVERVLDAHIPNPSFLEYSHRDNDGTLLNLPFSFKQRGLNEGAQLSLAAEAAVIDSYSSIVVEVGTFDRPASQPLVATATSRTLGGDGLAESSSSLLRRETRSGPSRANLGQSLKYLHGVSTSCGLRSGQRVVADTADAHSLDDLASKPADIDAVPARTTFLKSKALVRFTFYYKSRTRLRACGLLDKAAVGPLPNGPAVPRHTAEIAQSQTRASDATAAARNERAQPLPQQAFTAWQTPQLVLRTNQSQSQNQNQHSKQNQNQNQNQNESRNTSHDQMARGQHQQQHRSADPRRRPGNYIRVPAQSTPEHGTQAAGPSTGAHASGAKPPLLAPPPSTSRAEDQAREAKRIKREAFDDGLQQASGSAPRSPLALSPRSAARASASRQPMHQAARAVTLPQPSVPSAVPNMPRVAVPSGASQKPTGGQGAAVIDLTSDSDDEQDGEVPARRHAAARENGANRGIKQEGSGRMAAAPVAQRMQGATEAHQAVIQQGNAATAAQHQDQQAPVEHRAGAPASNTATVCESDPFLSHVEAHLGPDTAASVGDVLKDEVGLDISLEAIRIVFAICDEGGKEAIWTALAGRLTPFKRGVIRGLIEQKENQGKQ